MLCQALYAGSMKQYRPSQSPCPIGRASRVLGDRWAMLILREAMLGVERFEAFQARLDISRAALSSRLAILVEAGLLSRDPPGAKRAVYRLTGAGEALRPIYRDLAVWGTDHLPPPAAVAQR